MVSKTQDKCGFACHETNNENNYYNLAKSLGVTMRIDVVRRATQALMDTAADTKQFAKQFQVAIYTFGRSATDAKLEEITSLTSEFSSAKGQGRKHRFDDDP
ncbi:hypothetical protein LB565_07110 [Mesorhizobium sp. CA14]|uniref:hypothetical protein n=1 Tax=Mesorhizobium sp. CA14 TaxID=2876642 RepID=UPI001CC9D306|nr:hypothetical protein [Mesorhizobium sp. CA14]MBZ9847754.1 hypothetical protein [Mesorhizobium sp. CA14]